MSIAWGFAVRGEGSETLEIDVYDVIGESFWHEGVTAKKIRQTLKDNQSAATIKLRVNSAGGDVIDGFAIYNLLSEHPARVVADVDALAASMASVIIMAADEIRIASNAMVMIHNPWGGVLGEAEDLRRHADLLDKMRDQIASAYSSRTGQKRAAILKMMNEETWLDAAEAKELGFVDTVKPNKVKAAAMAGAGLNLANCQRVPPRFQGMARLPEGAVSEKPDQAAQVDLPFKAAEQQEKPQETQMSKAILAALGVDSEDAALKKIANLNSTAENFAGFNHKDLAAQRDFVAKIEKLTEAQGDEAAGTIKAWKEDAAAKAEAEQKLAEIQEQADKASLNAALDKAEADKKITPNDRKEMLALVEAGEFTVKGAVAYLERKAANAILSNEEGKDQGEVKTGENGAKTYEAMSNVERANLQASDPDLFKQLRADWEKRGMPQSEESAAAE